MKNLPLLASLLFLLPGCMRTVEVAQLSPNDVAQIEIFPSLWEGPGQPPDITVLKDAKQVQAVLTVLQPVGDADRRNIIDRARILVVEKTGKKILLQLQPGGDPAYYEYLGQGQAYRISRGPFLEVMDSLGMTWLPR
jgi:hypothetical protein